MMKVVKKNVCECGKKTTKQINPIFEKIICRRCLESNLRYKRITFSTVKTDYKLTREDLIGLPFEEIKNPHYSKGVPMRLYSKEQVKLITEKKFQKYAALAGDSLFNRKQVPIRFHPEKNGKMLLGKKEFKIIDRKHGIIVNTLAEALQQKGMTVNNDQNRDLIAGTYNNTSILFEVKTRSSLQNILTAIGQLMIYGTTMRVSVSDSVMVLPKKISLEFETALKKLDIKILYYRWCNNTPSFIELDEFLKQLNSRSRF